MDLPDGDFPAGQAAAAPTPPRSNSNSPIDSLGIVQGALLPVEVSAIINTGDPQNFPPPVSSDDDLLDSFGWLLGPRARRHYPRLTPQFVSTMSRYTNGDMLHTIGTAPVALTHEQIRAAFSSWHTGIRTVMILYRIPMEAMVEFGVSEEMFQQSLDQFHLWIDLFPESPSLVSAPFAGSSVFGTPSSIVVDPRRSRSTSPLPLDASSHDTDSSVPSTVMKRQRDEIDNVVAAKPAKQSGGSGGGSLVRKPEPKPPAPRKPAVKLTPNFHDLHAQEPLRLEDREDGLDRHAGDLFGQLPENTLVPLYGGHPPCVGEHVDPPTCDNGDVRSMNTDDCNNNAVPNLLEFETYVMQFHYYIRMTKGIEHLDHSGLNYTAKIAQLRQKMLQLLDRFKENQRRVKQLRPYVTNDKAVKLAAESHLKRIAALLPLVQDDLDTLISLLNTERQVNDFSSSSSSDNSGGGNDGRGSGGASGGGSGGSENPNGHSSSSSSSYPSRSTPPTSSAADPRNTSTNSGSDKTSNLSFTALLDPKSPSPLSPAALDSSFDDARYAIGPNSPGCAGALCTRTLRLSKSGDAVNKIDLRDRNEAMKKIKPLEQITLVQVATFTRATHDLLAKYGSCPINWPDIVSQPIRQAIARLIYSDKSSLSMSAHYLSGVPAEFITAALHRLVGCGSLAAFIAAVRTHAKFPLQASEWDDLVALLSRLAVFTQLFADFVEIAGCALGIPGTTAANEMKPLLVDSRNEHSVYELFRQAVGRQLFTPIMTKFPSVMHLFGFPANPDLRDFHLHFRPFIQCVSHLIADKLAEVRQRHDMMQEFPSSGPTVHSLDTFDPSRQPLSHRTVHDPQWFAAADAVGPFTSQSRSVEPGPFTTPPRSFTHDRQQPSPIVLCMNETERALHALNFGVSGSGQIRDKYTASGQKQQTPGQPPGPSTHPCHDFAINGSCSRGQQCRFSHDATICLAFARSQVDPAVGARLAAAKAARPLHNLDLESPFDVPPAPDPADPSGDPKSKSD